MRRSLSAFCQTYYYIVRPSQPTSYQTSLLHQPNLLKKWCLCPSRNKQPQVSPVKLITSWNLTVKRETSSDFALFQIVSHYLLVWASRSNCLKCFKKKQSFFISTQLVGGIFLCNRQYWQLRFQTTVIYLTQESDSSFNKKRQT